MDKIVERKENNNARYIVNIHYYLYLLSDEIAYEMSSHNLLEAQKKIKILNNIKQAWMIK